LDKRLSKAYPKWFNSKGSRTVKKLTSIEDEIREWDKYWNDLIYTMCEGDPVQMSTVVRFDIFDFFAFVENFMKKK
jgi:hypothetical protein